MKIMKVKQADGSIVSIPLGQGANGKSAYEYAKDGGYTGTEAEFAILLASIGSGGGGGGASTAEITAAIAAHNVNTSAHADIREQISQLSSEIVDIKQETVQQVPLFANSIEECTDTTKLYVLSDGFIYAYINEAKMPDNLVATSLNTDGVTVYNNGAGYKDGTYVSDAGSYGSVSGIVATGYIEYKCGEPIYIKGVTLDTSHSRVRIYFTDAIGGTDRCSATGGSNGGTISQRFTIEELGTNYYKITPKDAFYSAFKTSGVTVSQGDTVYYRLSAVGTGANLFISHSNPIDGTSTSGYQWTNTGHAFVPADYEDEIIANTSKITSLNQRVAILEAGGTIDGIESYVQEEAERVAKEVYSKQNANTFTFLAISDMHYNPANTQIITSNIHAGQGMDLVRKNASVDFAVVLGDNAWGSSIEGDQNRATIERGLTEIRSANKCLDAAFRGIPNFRTPGNHDNLGENYTWNGNDWLDGNEIFPLFGAYNRGAVYPSEKERGYCYRDFEDYKLRVICMNTSDLKGRDMSTGPSVYMSGTQMKWFAEILDMSAKADAAEWSIIIFSHTPLDYSISNQTVSILEAYINGTSVSFTKDSVLVSYNYEGKNAAAIIGNVHGHNHCFLVDDLRKHIGNGVTTPIDVKRICVPNACFNRSNERGQNNKVDMYDIEYGETTTYAKTAGTARDTAFNVITVDPVARKLYATNYGAGYDREVSYGTPTPVGPTYTNVLKIAYTPPTSNNVTPVDTSVFDGVGYRNGVRISEWSLQANADYVTTGVIKWRDNPGAFSGLKPIYIKGASADTSQQYVRCLLIQDTGDGLYYSKAINQTNWAETFTIEKLGEDYYKLTPLESGLSSWYNVRYIMFSLYGKGDNLIITIDEPIEGGNEPEGPAYTNLAANNYTDGKYISDAGAYGTDTATVATGYIKQTRNNPIYIKGCTFDETSHVRLYADSAQWGNDGAFVLWYCSGNTTADNSKFSTWYTVEELGDKYYKLTPKKDAIDARCTLTGYTNNYYWYRISVKGTGADLIITDGEPIE